MTYHNINTGHTTGLRNPNQNQDVYMVTFEEQLLGLKINSRPGDLAPVVNEVRTALYRTYCTLRTSMSVYLRLRGLRVVDMLKCWL